jgi:hypothetical protein
VKVDKLSILAYKPMENAVWMAAFLYFTLWGISAMQTPAVTVSICIFGHHITRIKLCIIKMVWGPTINIVSDYTCRHFEIATYLCGQQDIPRGIRGKNAKFVARTLIGCGSCIYGHLAKGLKIKIWPSWSWIRSGKMNMKTVFEMIRPL